MKGKTELLLSAEASKTTQRADLENHLETAKHALQDKEQVPILLFPQSRVLLFVFPLCILITPILMYATWACSITMDAEECYDKIMNGFMIVPYVESCVRTHAMQHIYTKSVR